jgi:hypothetical protein
MPEQLQGAVSMSVKLNMGNYQMAEVFMSVSGLTESTTPAEVAAILDGPVSNSLEQIKDRLRARMLELKPKREKQG